MASAPNPIQGSGLLLPVTVVVSLVGGAWMLRGALGDVQIRLGALEAKVDTLSEQVRDAGLDRWHGTDMRRWAARLQELNPALKIPEPVQ